MPTLRPVWLHGFASSPQSSKARFAAARFAARGLTLEVPDLNEPSFRSLTVSRMLARLDALDAARPQARLLLFGSSLGGYTAALWAAAHPERVASLVLLAPAFDLAAGWVAGMDAAQVERWRREGSLAFDHHALGRRELLDVGFLDDAAAHPPWPLPQAPTLVVQGTRDAVVRPALAREFTKRMQAAGRPVRLVELDDGHELTADLPALWREVELHLEGTNG